MSTASRPESAGEAGQGADEGGLPSSRMFCRGGTAVRDAWPRRIPPAGSLDPAQPSWEGRSDGPSERETSDVRCATCEDPDRGGGGRAGGRAGVGGGRDGPAVVVAELPRRGGSGVPVRGCAGAA